MTIATLPAYPSGITIESGNWLTARRSMPELAELTAEELMCRTQRELVVPLRYAKSCQGVSLIGECPLQSYAPAQSWETEASISQSPQEEAIRNLQHWLEGNSELGAAPNSELVNETVETVLTEAVHEWTHRDEYWIVSAGVQSPVELRVGRVPRGLRVEALLQSAEAFDSLTRQALAEFLCRVQLTLRFSRVELDEQVRIVSEVDTHSIQRILGHCVGSVSAACRLLATEVRALATPELARAYLSYVGAESEPQTQLGIVRR